MGFATGTSCSLHSPFLQSPFSTTSSQCSLRPPFSFCSLRNAPARTKNVTIMACLPQENRRDSNCCARRVVLVMGFAVIRLLKMRAEATDALAAENTELRVPLQKQNAKLSDHESSSQNPFFSLLNAFGFLGSGVLGGLYASTMKEKATSDATIESMTMKLKEREAAITSLEKEIEEELLTEKEVHNKALSKVNAEKQSLVNRLKLANDMITNLGQELEKEKRLVEELSIQVDYLEHNIHVTENEKRQLQHQLKEKHDSIAVLKEKINLLSSEIKDKEENIWHLSSKLADKERELNQLTTVYQQSEDQLTGLNLEIKQLKQVLLKNEEELELKNEMVQKLNAELTCFLSEKDESSKKLDAILKDYKQFKSSTEMKSASDAKLLGEREEKIHQLEEKCKISLDEANKDRILISDLTQEKESVKEILKVELQNVENLEKELKLTRDNLEKSRSEASDLAKHLQKSRYLCLELKAEVDKVEGESNEARESLQRNINESKQDVVALTEELRSANELLCVSNKELEIMSKELAASVQKCESLEKELVDTIGKAEGVAVELSEEEKTTSSLNKDLKDLEIQVLKDREARKRLESDLEEATESLSEMNRNALMLSRELELANSRISSMEDEKCALYSSLDVQKGACQEARGKLEGAHNLVMKLGKHRESLAIRGKKLEEELASAKGEILRLRSQISSPRTPVNNVQNERKVDVGGKVAANSRKVYRRRKINSQQQDS